MICSKFMVAVLFARLF